MIRCCSLAAALALFLGGSTVQAAAQAAPADPATALTGADPLTGDITFIRDPTLAHAGSLWYVISTDDVGLNLKNGSLPIHCSADRIHWQACGYVFSRPPAWVRILVPAAHGLWAPDLSYFNGQWHLYYAASALFSQVSVIGVATSPTLDQSSPDYAWTDHGPVLSSRGGQDFNALDPNLFLDAEHVPWLNYGSFWSGIKQRQVEPETGMTVASGERYNLAASPQTADHAIEAPAMLRHGGWYYLFVSTGHCCEADLSQDNYNIVVGRSRSVHGPFVDAHGKRMMQGGGTVLVSGGPRWVAPGSAGVYADSATGQSYIAFHALDMTNHGIATLWIETMTWKDDWPTLTR